MVFQQSTDSGLRELALFAGAGGGILGGLLLGWRTVCAVEFDPHARQVLVARQNDGMLPAFPIWDDVRTFNGRPWCGIVDVVSGGFPCQDISSAGKGAGIIGERSGLWVEMARIIGEVRPRYAFVENSPMLTSRGLGYILGDLAALGYDAQWGVLGACDAGAPHQRERIWLLAYTDVFNPEPRREIANMGSEATEIRGQGADPFINFGFNLDYRKTKICNLRLETPYGCGTRCDAWKIEPELDRVADGIPDWVDRLERLGNAQVPAVVRLAWQKLIAEV
jgi:DNA (cytosine-5)-methyltransferase 1